MSYRKAKSAPKTFKSDRKYLKEKVISTMGRVADIVGSSLGPSGRVTLIESDLPGIPNTLTKDGVTIFKALGAHDPFEHLIIESARDVAQRTASEAGDGPQPLWSKILTPTGYIEMKDVEVGMTICGTNGTFQKVLGVYPKGQREILKVKFSDGRVVECCKDHLWNVTTNRGTNKTLPLSEIMRDFHETTSSGKNRHRYYVPKAKVEFESSTKKMPLDPYLVGLLIGDGCLRESGSIDLSLGKNKKHVLNKIVLPQGISATSKWVEDKSFFRVKITGKTADGLTMRDLLTTIGLYNTDSSTKHIPHSYLFSSEKHRLALLQGLLDTDGYVNSRKRFEFSTVSVKLAKDFISLVRSLGRQTTLSLHTKENDLGSYSGIPIYRMFERKAYKHGVKIVDIERTGIFTEMQCIKVSNPDSLYITDDFIVTHNTTTATVLSHAIIQNLFEFCEANPRYSPQKATRRIAKVVKESLIPYVKSRSVKIDGENRDLLKMVAKISANGDEDLANAVIEAFDAVGFGEDSHITIRQLSGPAGYKVERIDGFPIGMGFEDSCGKLHTAFINDTGLQRCYMEKPLFILYDGQIHDLSNIAGLLAQIDKGFKAGDVPSDKVVIVAHGFAENVMNDLAFNFVNPHTMKVLPLVTPMAQFINSQTHFLHDLAAFTGARVFGFKDQIGQALPSDLGSGMESIECYRFRSTVVGNPDATNVEVRADDLKTMLGNAESQAERNSLQERIGKITNGIAKLTIFAGTSSELREIHDRCEDAALSVRAAITHGALPGGCRIAIDMATKLSAELEQGDPAREVLMPSLLALPCKLLDNAGFTSEEVKEVLTHLVENPQDVYDLENNKFGNALELGLLDATKAVTESLTNAVSIASVLGTMGGIIAHPRDDVFERSEAMADMEWERNVKDAHALKNEANERP